MLASLGWVGFQSPVIERPLFEVKNFKESGLREGIKNG